MVKKEVSEVQSMEQQEQSESIEDICEKFERWRLSRKNPRERIPASLWQSAAIFAKDRSINAVAKALRLNGQDLKKQVAKYCGKHQVKTEAEAPSGFIELTSEAPVSSAEYTIELSDQKGIKMRITLKGNHNLDIARLISSFRTR
jgi:hypothetical protein